MPSFGEARTGTCACLCARLRAGAGAAAAAAAGLREAMACGLGRGAWGVDAEGAALLCAALRWIVCVLSCMIGLCVSVFFENICLAATQDKICTRL